MGYSRARIIAEGYGSGGGGGGGEYAGSYADAFHAFTVDDDGMLIYTKINFDSDEEVKIAADASDSSWQGVTYSFDNYDHRTGLPNSNTNYDQYKFSGRELFYFINDDGDLIARFIDNYDYTGPR
jgi:hypothetical protein